MTQNGYAALTSKERREDEGFVPFGWFIEVPGTKGDFVQHSETDGYVQAKKRALELHSTTIVPVFRERRKFG